MSKLNVKTGDCALCNKKDVDTIQADCHVLYRGEWINQVAPVCFECTTKRVTMPVKELKEPKKEEAKPKPKPEVKYPKEVAESWPKQEVKEPVKEKVSKPESVFYAGKHSKK